LDYSPIIEFISEAFAASYRESQSTKRELLGLKVAWLQRAKFRRGSAAANALRKLIQHPIVSTKNLADLLGVSFQAASVAIKTLTDCKIIRERSGRQKDRIFAAEEVIGLLARPFGQDPHISLSAARDHLLNTNRTLGQP
jgi:hypothetical protein